MWELVVILINESFVETIQWSWLCGDCISGIWCLDHLLVEDCNLLRNPRPLNFWLLYIFISLPDPVELMHFMIRGPLRNSQFFSKHHQSDLKPRCYKALCLIIRELLFAIVHISVLRFEWLLRSLVFKNRYPIYFYIDASSSCPVWQKGPPHRFQRSSRLPPPRRASWHYFQWETSSRQYWPPCKRCSRLASHRASEQSSLWSERRPSPPLLE